MPLSYSSYYVYDTGNGCLPCEVNGAIFSFYDVVSGWKFLSCVSLKHDVPSPLNGTLPSARSYQDSRNHFICPAVCLRCASLILFCVCLFLCMSVFTFFHPLLPTPPSLLLQIHVSPSDSASARFAQLSPLVSAPCK